MAKKMENEQFAKHLFEKYKKMFYHVPYVECPQGWFQIIEELTKELVEISKDFRDDSIKVVEIKEKFGGLRYCVDYDLPSEQITLIEQTIRYWESKSYKVCSACGSEEDVVRSRKYWEQTLCKNCKQ